MQSARSYGAFEGVFVPTLLTILGVILFLRTGWVVGNAGLAGALGIIGLAYLISGATGLSIASVATNTPLGGGGAYAIISRSLGLEAGGAIGIPLYLAQALVIALYVFGFRSGWQFLFPNHPALVVDLVTFGVIVAIAGISAKLAFRVQYLILALIACSIVSVAVTVFGGALQFSPTLVGSFPGAPETGFAGTGFWAVFAVFFPATTGIMAGANLSGELADSRRAIPRGTLAAIGVSLVVYVAAAVWLSMVAGPDRLVRNYLIMVDRSAFGPAVLAGLLGATFSSALASLVGAPRILQALGEARLLPASGWFAARTDSGEPRHALIVSALIALAAIAARDLNVLAPVITLFFLITYGTVNVVVLVESAIDLDTFRPTLRLPLVVPLIGAVGCIVAMVVVNPLFTLVAVAAVAAILVVLVRRNLDSPFSDIRSDLFAALSRWASRRAVASRSSAERGWRPRVLAAVADPGEAEVVLPFLRDLTYPKGAVKLVAVRNSDSTDAEALTRMAAVLQREQIATTCSVVDAASVQDGFLAGMRAEGISFERSNVVFLRFPHGSTDERTSVQVLREARQSGLGVVVLSADRPGRLGGRGVVNLWIREQGPEWEVSKQLQHSHLAILLCYKLVRNWGGDLNLVTAVTDVQQTGDADRYLHGLAGLARLPGPPGVHVIDRGFPDALAVAPVADLNVFAMPPTVEFARLRDVVEAAGTPTAFVRDSGEENAFV